MPRENLSAGAKCFFAYARRRHEIYLRREADLPRERWTKDPILQQYKFTNVFRELDRVTQWFREHVREPQRNRPSSVLLATVVFRMFNRIETGEAIFLHDGGAAFDEFRATGKTRAMRAAIEKHVGDGPTATGAYIISSPPGYTKRDGILKMLEWFYKAEIPLAGTDRLYARWTDVASEVGELSLGDAWDWFRQHEYFGPFHAYEIVTDLRHTRLLERAPDIMTWANPGPGAKRGWNRVRGADKDSPCPRENIILGMQQLLAMAHENKYWPQRPPAHGSTNYANEWPAWEMRDVEHTLCEFDKYERVRLGEGRPRSVFKPVDAPPGWVKY